MIKPLGTKVLLGAPEKEEEITTSGILLPGEAQKETGKATVVAVGDAVVNVKAGDRVLIQKFNSASPLKHEGVEYLIIDEKEIIAKL